MIYRRWTAHLYPGYSPSLADLYANAADLGRE